MASYPRADTRRRQRVHPDDIPRLRQQLRSADKAMDRLMPTLWIGFIILNIYAANIL